MDFEREVLPRAFNALQRPDLNDIDTQQDHWRYQAVRALQDQLASKAAPLLEDALLWDALSREIEQQPNGQLPQVNEYAFNTGFETRLHNVQQALAEITAPNAVCLILGDPLDPIPGPDPEEELYDDGEAPHSRVSGLWLGPHIPMKFLEGNAMVGVFDASFGLPKPIVETPDSLHFTDSFAKEIAEPIVTFWQMPTNAAEKLKKRRESRDFWRGLMEGFTGREAPSQAENEDERESMHRSLDNSAGLGEELSPVSLPLASLYKPVITKDTVLDGEILTDIIKGKHVIVAGQEAIEKLFQAVNPDVCDAWVDKETCRVFQDGLARLLRNSNRIKHGEMYSPMDAVIEGEFADVIKAHVRQERDDLVGSIIDEYVGSAVNEIIGNSDPFMASEASKKLMQDAFFEVWYVHQPVHTWCGIESATPQDIHQQVKETLSGKLEQATRNLRRLSKVAIDQFDELKSDEMFEDGEVDLEKDE